jgi:hypothetical protein
VHLIRGLAGALLWILSAVLALVALILCITVILLPLGLPLLGYARRLFTLSLKLIVPRAVSHPVKSTKKPLRHRGQHLKKDLGGVLPDLTRMRKHGRKRAPRIRKPTSIFS